MPFQLRAATTLLCLPLTSQEALSTLLTPFLNDTLLLLLSALCITPPSPLNPISPSSSPVLNDVDLDEARGMPDLAERLENEGIVAFFCLYQSDSGELLVDKSDKEFLGKQAEGIHCTLLAEGP